MQKRCNLVVRRRQTCEFYFENQCFTEFWSYSFAHK
jgi:hypothetical protein